MSKKINGSIDRAAIFKKIRRPSQRPIAADLSFSKRVLPACRLTLMVARFDLSPTLPTLFFLRCFFSVVVDVVFFSFLLGDRICSVTAHQRRTPSTLVVNTGRKKERKKERERESHHHHHHLQSQHGGRFGGRGSSSFVSLAPYCVRRRVVKNRYRPKKREKIDCVIYSLVLP